MRRCLFLALIGAFGLLPTPLAAQEVVTLQGEVVDMACYLAKDKKGRVTQELRAPVREGRRADGPVDRQW
jgi:hypothetical protein